MCDTSGRNALQSGLLQSCFPDAPPEWTALQSPMELVAPDLKGQAVIGDDKDHSKIWVADQVDLCRYVAKCVEMDQTWARRDDLRPRDVSVWLWARAFLGFPAWLRRGKLATAGNVKFPTVFPLVKGKCFSVTGTRKCEKAGHSCMRRVVDCAGGQKEMWLLGVVVERFWRILGSLQRSSTFPGACETTTCDG